MTVWEQFDSALLSPEEASLDEMLKLQKQEHEKLSPQLEQLALHKEAVLAQHQNRHPTPTQVNQLLKRKESISQSLAQVYRLIASQTEQSIQI